MEGKQRMNASDILAQTLEHGGGTFRPDGGRIPSDGYVVAIHEGTFARLPIHQTDDGPVVAESAFVHILSALGDLYPGALIGTWIDKGTLHVDPVLIVPNVAQATAIGRATSQQAIYDLRRQETITL